MMGFLVTEPTPDLHASWILVHAAHQQQQQGLFHILMAIDLGGNGTCQLVVKILLCKKQKTVCGGAHDHQHKEELGSLFLFQTTGLAKKLSRCQSNEGPTSREGKRPRRSYSSWSSGGAGSLQDATKTIPSSVIQGQ